MTGGRTSPDVQRRPDQVTGPTAAEEGGGSAGTKKKQLLLHDGCLFSLCNSTQQQYIMKRFFVQRLIYFSVVLETRNSAAATDTPSPTAAMLELIRVGNV